MNPDPGNPPSGTATGAMSYDPELWTYRYDPGQPVAPYGDDTTYKAGLGWLWETCRTVEDWGAGAAYGRKFTPAGRTYIAVDGSPESEPYVDHVADLRTWTPAKRPEGIFIRHVLEHNLEWRDILRRALFLFARRLVVVTFTPFTMGPTRAMRPEGDRKLDLSFNINEFAACFGGFRLAGKHYRDRAALQYGQEHLFKVTHGPKVTDG